MDAEIPLWMYLLSVVYLVLICLINWAKINDLKNRNKVLWDVLLERQTIATLEAAPRDKHRVFFDIPKTYESPDRKMIINVTDINDFSGDIDMTVDGVATITLTKLDQNDEWRATRIKMLR